MAKKQKPKKHSPELKRWAIEQAMRWPQVHCATNYTAGGTGHTMWIGGSQYADADIVGRAQKLLEFLKD